VWKKKKKVVNRMESKVWFRHQRLLPFPSSTL